MATETWWYHDAYCDWAPIRPHPTRPCLGGCGTHIDGIGDFCLRCKADPLKVKGAKGTP
jgi:hypothetical protein